MFNEELKNAISPLKNNNAPGSDLITAEVLKTGGKPKVNMLHMIFLEIVNVENTPLYFSKRVVPPIFKERDAFAKTTELYHSYPFLTKCSIRSC